MFRTLPADNVRAGRLSVAGRSSRVSSHFTKAWTSLRRMFASCRLPSRGRMWRRSALSMILAVPGDDTWIDVVLGRVKVGPVRAPWVAGGAISIDGVRTPLGGIGRILGTKVAEQPTGARLSLGGPDGLSVEVDVGAGRERFVGWSYADPNGNTHDVANCSIADIEVRVSRPKRPELILHASGTAAYELGMREVDHGIAIQPFIDIPRPEVGRPEPLA